jgi:hypothetical protein
VHTDVRTGGPKPLTDPKAWYRAAMDAEHACQD